MIKRVVSFCLVLVLTFSFFVCGSSDPNMGSISGLRGSEYTAHFLRSDVLFRQNNISINSRADTAITLISDSQELTDWHDKNIQEAISLWPLESLPDYAHKIETNLNSFFLEITGNYEYTFFVKHQLILISHLLACSASHFEISRLIYQNKTLTIELRQLIPRTKGCSSRVLILPNRTHWFSIVELTRIPSDFEITLQISN